MCCQAASAVGLHWEQLYISFVFVSVAAAIVLISQTPSMNLLPVHNQLFLPTFHSDVLLLSSSILDLASIVRFSIIHL